jgi:hypothetical protein
MGHWHNQWCENDIIVVTQLLLTCPRMLIYNLCIWITYCNLVIIIFRLCCTAVINKIYPCATYGPEQGSGNVSTRESVTSLDRKTNLLIRRWRQQVHPKRKHICTKQLGVTLQNALIWIFNRPSNHRECVIPTNNCLCLKPDHYFRIFLLYCYSYSILNHFITGSSHLHSPIRPDSFTIKWHPYLFPTCLIITCCNKIKIMIKFEMHSVVGIVTRLRATLSRVWFPTGKINLFFSKISRPVVKLTQPLIERLPRFFSQSVKRASRDVDHSPASCVEVRRSGVTTPLPLHAFVACTKTTLPLHWFLIRFIQTCW